MARGNLTEIESTILNVLTVNGQNEYDFDLNNGQIWVANGTRHVGDPIRRVILADTDLSDAIVGAISKFCKAKNVPLMFDKQDVRFYDEVILIGATENALQTENTALLQDRQARGAINQDIKITFITGRSATSVRAALGAYWSAIHN